MVNISQVKEQAEAGDVVAMRKLALAYVEGNDVERNLDEAEQWLRRAAELGDAEAQSEYADVLRAEKKYEEAFQWEQKAAEQGFPHAQYNLAVCFKDGIGTPVNLEKQCYWYQKAAENGNVESRLQLSRCYLQGDGVPQDMQQALHWLHQASDKGNAEAKRRLGAAYFEGIGCSMDKEKGIAFLQEAIALGDDQAKGLLEEAQRSMRGAKPSLLGMIVNKFFGTIGDAFRAFGEWTKFSFRNVSDEAKKHGNSDDVPYGCLFGIFIFIAGVCIGVLKYTALLILSPLIATYEYLQQK